MSCLTSQKPQRYAGVHQGRFGRAIGKKCEGAEVVSWDVVFAKQAFKDAEQSEILLEPTRAASTSSIAWSTRYSPKSGPSVYCVCGPTMSERANTSTHAGWHNATSQYGCSPRGMCIRSYQMNSNTMTIEKHHLSSNDWIHGQRNHSPTCLLGRLAWKFQDRCLGASHWASQDHSPISFHKVREP